MSATDENQTTQFMSVLEEVRQQLLEAQIHFDIWQELLPTERVIEVINRYRGFILPTRKAHLDSFFIKVSNVIDNDPRAPSFYKLFKMLDNNQSLAPSIDIKTLRRQLKQHKEVLRAIKDYRNSKSAHADTQEKTERKPVLFGKSKRMLKELQDIFNNISGAHSQNIWSFSPIPQNNTSILLDKLKGIR